MLITVLAGFVLAIFAPWISRISGRATGAFLAIGPLLMFVYFAAQIGTISTGDVIRQSTLWAPDVIMGVDLSFYLDGLSLLFALLITGIGTLIVLYAGAYMAGHEFTGRFFAWLLAFLASMLGLVLADNIITLFIFWELTSITSYFLIGFDHHREVARKNALQALLITGGGGLALLAGLIMLASAGGSMQMSELLSSGDVLREHALYVPILILILLGAFTKSAQWPFHFWLPNAMEAPTPVSAYLHSSTMVKAGVYLLARLSPALGDTPLWMILLTSFGGVTMVLGAYLAIRQTYLKKILAYSTISALGVLVFLLGIGAAGVVRGESVDPGLALYAAQAFAVFLLAHALYKAALFLVAGSIAHATGVADVTKLVGLARVMPFTMVGALLAALSMAGFPPFFGFISKELLFEATLKEPAWGTALTSAAVLAGILFVVVSCLVAVRPFFGRRANAEQGSLNAHESPAPMWIAPLLLGIAGLLFGLLPKLVGEPLIAPVVTSVMGLPELAEVKLLAVTDIHVNLALILGGVVLAVGFVLFALHNRISRVIEPFDALNRVGPERGYAVGLAGLLRFAGWQTRMLQSGSLRNYLLITILTIVGLGVSAIFRQDELYLVLGLPDESLAQWLFSNFYAIVICGLILVGAAGAVHSQHRLSSVASLGVVGYGVALIYVVYGAPDLAITQFIIETLIVILFVFVVYHLPRFPRISRTPQRVRDLAIATVAGTMMAVLVLMATGQGLHPEISHWHIEEAWQTGKGRNIVNVILVDFRALDTLGELTVLAASAIGVLALFKLRPRRRQQGKEANA